MNLNDKLRIGTKILKGVILKQSTPISIEFSLTYRCNLSCTYCGVSLDYARKYFNQSNEMTIQEIRKMIGILSGLGVERINISGGEPFTRDDIPLILEEIFCKKLKVTLTSNDILVPKYLKLLQKLDLLIISLDGKKYTNDYFRGKDTFEHSLKAIEMSKKKGIKVAISTVITSKTTKEDLYFILQLCDFYDCFCLLQPASNRVFFDNG